MLKCNLDEANAPSPLSGLPAGRFAGHIIFMNGVQIMC